MKHFKKILILLIIGLVSADGIYAGNENRAGEAGASELLINPWARSSGFANANTAQATGLESQFLNVAGLAFTRKTELLFTHCNYLQNTGIGINAFGFSQKVGESGVLGLGVMSMNFGNIDITTSDLPEGGIGTFSPSYLNLNASYARTFSNSIYGGVNFKVISESISNVGAHGVAVDAGIRYVTGKNDNIKFGIALKNVGPEMQFSGDGLDFRDNNSDKSYSQTQQHRSAGFELPSLLNIGGSYDFYINPHKDSTSDKVISDHRITLALNFTSNSFTKDDYDIGIEYAFKNKFMVRTGYAFHQGQFGKNYVRTNIQTGLCAGLTVQVPINKSGSTIGVDYSYRLTDAFQGIHSIGARFNL